MKQKIKQTARLITAVLFTVIFAIGCQPDPLEYARPKDLVGTIYLQLKAMGGFEYYVKCIEKTAYKTPLEKGGSWTVFAPTDEAFEEFMREEGFGSFDEIPSERILDLVQYSVLSGGWNTTSLTYFNNAGVGNAFKKTTQYLDTIIDADAANFPYVDEVEPGRVYKLDNSSGRDKTVAYFLPYYMESKGIEKADYNFIFDGETYADTDQMKVYEANAVRANIVAENGFIHALDKVIEPRENIYQALMSDEYKDKYSMFKNLIDRFASFNSQGFQLNEATGQQEEIFRLGFRTGLQNNLLPYNPYDEAYPPLLNNANRTPSNAVGMAIPTNEALTSYLEGNSILGQFYNSYDDMSIDVLATFLGTHFFSNYYDLCPSREGSAFNVSLNLVDYSTSDAVDKRFCSNGLFVGVNKVYTNKNFSTVLGPLLLNPDYTIMLKAIQGLGIADGLSSRGSNFSVFGIANNQFIDIPDPNSATRRISVVDFTDDFSVVQIQVTGDPDAANNRLYPENIDSPISADVNYVNTTLEAIVLNQIVDEKVTLNSDNFYQTRSRAFIKALPDGSLAGGGDLLANEKANITLTRTTENGNFYEMDKHFQRPLDFAYKSLVDNSDKFSKFIEVLEAVDGFITIPGYADDKLLSFVSSTRSYTMFAPNDAAVQQAITDGVIVDPNNLPTDAVELAIAKRDLLNFAKLHVFQDPIVTDGVSSGDYKSLYFAREIDFSPVYDEFQVSNFLTELSVEDPETGIAIATTGGLLNLFSKGIVIHELDGYLKF
ncbi:hypothetical protein AXE80_03525 [Wenyingzhuangia fucanilytica]|uniref:FAS1 domain-containing protein n=1 Tax=Wenyingzhuangia fucanilytica TaxID=1790137 RepID=A0A1B1Y3Q7_9FLAO|nr:fasciclin domain-containing protein [Wenyingzhuangia fucanilytica]ANW95404.1 hypothetical protein AXE80_03525 [Wenyingzhuangia fucanilytica]